MANREVETEKDRVMAFQSIVLFKRETLGTGSYGAVCKAKCDELECAAKLLYPVLFQMEPKSSKAEKQHRRPKERFESECHFLSLFHHPNIVQYLGVHTDPDTNAPVLLMELMDESLTHYLESSPGDIPYHIQVNLTSDIAQALSFLHANGIIHRDLSSNNVLLLAGRAKVADFGMSKFDSRLSSMTTCPGTPAFMSPEALNEPPVYTEKLDVFSLGVLMIQIMTREYPEPSQRFVMKEVIDPSYPGVKINAQLSVPESDRRHAQVRLVRTSHPLLPIAQMCIRDNDNARPLSKEVCQLFTCIKESTAYKDSRSSKGDQSEGEYGAACGDEIARLKENLRKKESELKEKNCKLEEATDQLQAAKREIHFLKTQSEPQRGKMKKQKEKQDKKLKHSISEGGEEPDTGTTVTHKRRTRHHSEETGITTPDFNRQLSRFIKKSSLGAQKSLGGTDWLPLSDCPISIQAGTSTVVGNRAYFQNKDSGAIVEYNSSTGIWSLKPFHPLRLCTLACVEGNLTTVGGYDETFTASNKLYSLLNQQWSENLPAMPTKRDSSAVVSTSTSLIVAGGRNKFQVPLKTVEVLGMSSKQWIEATSLPFPTSLSSTVVYRGSMYMTAGDGGYNHPSHAVISCPLETLFRRSSLPSEQLYVNTTRRVQMHRVPWMNIENLPVQNVCLAEVNDRLLAFGGSLPPKANSSTRQPAQSVYEYNSTENTWNLIGQMTIGRNRCLGAVLQGNKLMVVGGISGSNPRSKMAEFTTFEDCT